MLKAKYPRTGPKRNRAMIKPLQCGLKLRGYFNAEPTGTWGPITTRAVKSFQRANRHRVQKRFTPADWWSLRVQLGLVANARTTPPGR